MAAMNNRKLIKNTEDIKGEIADVMVMLKEIQLYYNIKTEDIKEVMTLKIDRQIERIENE